jgi:lipopolysaccharide/colanic/teichoic acid biosynthesis glycosyltransferase
MNSSHAQVRLHATACTSALRLQRVCKWVIDVVGSLCAIALLAPLFAVIAIVIKLHDGGSIIYRRRVLGLRGEFDAYKFRSMRPDADAVLRSQPELRRAFEHNFKLQYDPRVTKVGAILRKYSLDELPQLFNVLKGDMSLVGPRMITAAELDRYGEYRKLLLTAKPGLTGYWQVNGRQTTSYGDRVQMDIFYIRNWSLLLDLHILLKTPISVLRAEGSF